ncbi:MAG: hypothetical protein CVU89_07640 [Firmicutes bacterium HGW-Firmicutes-14]|nr:MAG: hypothetical protein CVU89_07640 [Firmicutes bacterium HGW-Firmicutes-14]
MKRNRGTLFPRRYFRIPFEKPVEFSILKYNRRYIAHLSTKRGPGKGHDIGEDGLSFVSPYSLPVDMVLRVVFELPDIGEQRILARVVRSGPVDAGFLTAVQFLNLHGQRKERLRDYIASETRKSYRFLKFL